MPLLINNVVLDDMPHDTRTLFQTYPHFKEVSNALTSQTPKVVGPVGLVYVHQREYAVTAPHDKHISILGTDDATTCHCVILRQTGSGAVALGHFDGSGLEQGIGSLIHRVQELSMNHPEGQLELHIVGGFIDRRGFSEELSLHLLYAFHKQPIHVHLITACLGELNNSLRGNINWPIIYGIGINVKNGELFPATFTNKGPDIPLRLSRCFSKCIEQMLDIYDCNVGLLRIGPFNYEPLRGVELWLAQNNDVILQHLSTSPEVEPPHFVSQLRTILKFIQQNPFPGITVFPDNRPHYFRQDDTGSWIPVCY